MPLNSNAMSRHALVTGGAGFIGSHVVDRLLRDGWRVTIIDTFDPFYDGEIKRNNLKTANSSDRVRLIEADIRDLHSGRHRVPADIDVIVHLAAKPGVQPSLSDPVGFQDVNVGGTQRVLELARTLGVTQFVFASSSSVYGINPHVPWREDDYVLRPISPYASTKVSGELLGHVYSHLYGIRFVALRFFTVYGPRQRPDLAIHKFAQLMREGRPIPFFGDGSTRRDYTFIRDIIQGIIAAIEYSSSQFEVINLGNDRTVTLAEMVETLEQTLGVRAKLQRKSIQPGDVPQTWADISKAHSLLGYMPATSFDRGVREFVDWFNASTPIIR
jgi:UDP-glucuronate 4-epimerase